MKEQNNVKEINQENNETVELCKRFNGIKKVSESIGEDTNKFLKKWGERKDKTRFMSFSFLVDSSLIKLHNFFSGNKYDLSELARLEFYRWIDEGNKTKSLINAVRIANGAFWVKAGVDALQGEELMSKWELIIAPPIEIILSRAEWYVNARKEKRDEFIKDSQQLLDTFHKLKINKDNKPKDYAVINLEKYGNIIEELDKSVKIKEDIEKLNNELREVIEKVKEFFDDYDINKDGKIDDLEWMIARKKFTDCLKKRQPSNEVKWKQIEETDKKIKEINETILKIKFILFKIENDTEIIKLLMNHEIPEKEHIGWLEKIYKNYAHYNKCNDNYELDLSEVEKYISHPRSFRVNSIASLSIWFGSQAENSTQTTCIQIPPK